MSEPKLNYESCNMLEVWCLTSDPAQGNKNLERNKTQNDKIAEVYCLLGCYMVGGISFLRTGKMHHTLFQGSSIPNKNATEVSIWGLSEWLLGRQESCAD